MPLDSSSLESPRIPSYQRALDKVEFVLGHVLLGGTAINYAAGTPTVVLFPKYTESVHTFPAALPEPYLTTLSITKRTYDDGFEVKAVGEGRGLQVLIVAFGAWGLRDRRHAVSQADDRPLYEKGEDKKVALTLEPVSTRSRSGCLWVPKTASTV